MLINKSHVRKFALDKAAEIGRRMASTGEPRFTRVSAQFLEDINGCVINCIESKVRAMPSAGRTL